MSFYNLIEINNYQTELYVALAGQIPDPLYDAEQTHSQSVNKAPTGSAGPIGPAVYCDNFDSIRSFYSLVSFEIVSGRFF